jgi:hypothetical protein
VETQLMYLTRYQLTLYCNKKIKQYFGTPVSILEQEFFLYEVRAKFSLEARNDRNNLPLCFLVQQVLQVEIKR